MAYKVYPEKHRNILNSPLKFLFKFSRILGIAPVEFTSRGLRISSAYVTYSKVFILIMYAVILTGFGIDLANADVSLRANTPSTALTWICNLTILMTITGIGCFKAPERLKCIINVLNRMDEIRYKLGVIKKKDPTLHVQYAMLFCFITSIAILIVIDYNSYVDEAYRHKLNIKTFYMYSLFYVEFIIQILLELQFSLTALQLRNILKMCNDELEYILHKISLKAERNERNNDANKKLPVKHINKAIDTLYEHFQESDKEYYNKAIRALAHIYEDICNDEQDINRVFGTLLVFILFSFLLYLVITPYYIITYLQYSADHTATILLQTVWLTFHGFNLVLVTEPCHLMQVEVYRTRVLVSKLLHRSCIFSDSLYQELCTFSQMLLINKFNYAPFGLCVLERPLITKILGAVTTYLVIIIQFRGGNNEW